jgi:hypothetical protein
MKFQNGAQIQDASTFLSFKTCKFEFFTNFVLDYLNLANLKIKFRIFFS